MNILVTGGLGYIGSHIVTELIDSSKYCEVFIIDNLSNSKYERLFDIKSSLEIKSRSNRIHFIKLDLSTESDRLKEFMKYAEIDSVIHMAGLKAVGESTKFPSLYYDVNINSTLNLIESMKLSNVKNLIFSSTASVYGNSDELLTETSPIAPSNPYASSKYAIEKLLESYSKYHGFNITILRYFNPIGCHNKYLIGENPNGLPNNIVPFLTKSHNYKIDKPLTVFGNDYNTIDGTGVRDYIHVSDLADAHIVALRNLNGYHLYNVGTGKGTSVMELIHYLEEISGRKVNYIIGDRRPGDVATCVADPSKIKNELGWFAQYSVKSALKSHWEYELRYNNE